MNPREIMEGIVQYYHDGTGLSPDTAIQKMDEYARSPKGTDANPVDKDIEAILREHGADDEYGANYEAATSALTQLFEEKLVGELERLSADHEPHLCNCYVMNHALPDRINQLRSK